MGYQDNKRGDRVRINERIRFSPLQVIDDSGANLGEMTNFEAVKLAAESGLDLVEINPTARPPICKIMDYGRFKYDAAKKERERKSKQKEIELKEVRLTLKIGDHDLSYKAKQARTFVDRGDKVKVSMRLRGRENAFVEQALGVFDKFAAISGLLYESRPRKMGNMINAQVLGVDPEAKRRENAEIKDTQSDNKES